MDSCLCPDRLLRLNQVDCRAGNGRPESPSLSAHQISQFSGSCMKATNQRHQSTTNCYWMYVSFDAGITSSVCMLIIVSQSSTVHEERMTSNFSFPSAFWCQNLSRDNSRHPMKKGSRKWILETFKDSWLMWLKTTWEDSAIWSARKRRKWWITQGTYTNEPTIKQLGDSKDAERLIGVFARRYGLGCILVHNHWHVQMTRTPTPSKRHQNGAVKFFPSDEMRIHR